MLGRSISAKDRTTISRATETAEERESRLEQDRTKHATLRQAESSEEWQNRIGQERARRAASRAAETPQLGM